MSEVTSSTLESVGKGNKAMKKKKEITRPSRIGINLDRAENGYVVNLSSEGEGKNAAYTSKRLVAPDGRSALKIATVHLQSLGTPKMKSKKEKKTSSRKSNRAKAI